MQCSANKRIGPESRHRGFGLVGTPYAQPADDWCSQWGTLQTLMPNEVTDGLALSMLDSFSGVVRTASYEFTPVIEDDPRRETTGSDSYYAPEAWCSRKEKLQAQRAEDWCSRKVTLKTQMSNGATDGLAPSFFLSFFGRS